jgi:hypothetical protein
VTRGRRPIREFQVEISNEKSPPRISPRGLNSCDDGHMRVICPACQILSKAELHRDAAAAANAAGLTLKSSRRFFRRGLNLSEDEDMQVICPTWQALYESSFIDTSGAVDWNRLQRRPSPPSRPLEQK